jgi:Tfp pilus assembly protein PilV
MSLNFSRLRSLTERGDTVVEVLISIAVVSLILGGAFVTSNRNLQSTRDAEERSNALKITEAQVEQIRYKASNDPNVIFGPSTPASFCISGTAALDSSHAFCSVNASGGLATDEPAYRMAITRSGNTFTITTSWTKVGSDQQNNVQLKYRVYQ